MKRTQQRASTPQNSGEVTSPPATKSKEDLERERYEEDKKAARMIILALFERWKPSPKDRLNSLSRQVAVK